MATLLGVLEDYHKAKGTADAGTQAKLDAANLGTRLAFNPNARKLLNDATNGSDPNKPLSADQKALTTAMIDKWKSDPDFVKNINEDLANPQTAAKLQAAMDKNPRGVAAALNSYQPGNLAQIIPAAVAPAAAPAAPAAKPPAAEKPAVAKPDPELARRGRAAPAAAPAEPPATTVKKDAAPAAAPAAPAVKPADAKPAPIDVAAEKEVTRNILKGVAAGSDEDIKKAIDKDFVKRMADGLADFGADNFKELGPDAQGFKDKIKADPALQERIAQNLRDNPKLIRDLAEAMDNKDAGKGVVGSAIKGKLKEIYANPAVLADKDYTTALSSQMDMSKGGLMGGVGNWMKSTLGIDLNGIGAGLGGFFQGIMNWIGKFFNSFSSGNFALMGNLNPKMGMFDRLQASMERAERADQLRGYEEVLPRNRAKGPIGDGIERTASGKPVMVEKVGPDGQKTSEPKYDPTADHRVTVGGHKFYLTDKLNPMPVQNDPEGRVRWYVAKEINGQGQATNIDEIVLSKEDSEKLYKRMQEAAQAKGQPLQAQDPATAPASPIPVNEKTHKTNYDYKTGHEIVRPQPGDPSYQPAYTQPVRPPGQIEVRPLDAAPSEPKPIPVS